MKRLLFLILLAVAGPVKGELPTWLKASPRFSSTYPIYVLGGAGFSFWDQFELNMGIGNTPEIYSSAIGKATASATGNPADEKVIHDSLQRNSLFRIGAKYFFSNVRSGFTVGVGTSRIQSRGQTDIDTVLAPSTGRDFSLLKNVLSLAGRGSAIDINSTLDIADATLGYRWDISSHISLDFELGYTKAYAADLRFNSGMPNYENSLYGQTQLRGTEQDLETMILANGMSPTFGLGFTYIF